MKKQEMNPAAGENRQPEASPYYSHVQSTIVPWLQKVRFRKCLFGGVNEADVWKKLEELNAMYETALAAERARYDALLEAQQKAGDDHRP